MLQTKCLFDCWKVFEIPKLPVSSCWFLNMCNVQSNKRALFMLRVEKWERSQKLNFSPQLSFLFFTQLQPSATSWMRMKTLSRRITVCRENGAHTRRGAVRARLWRQEDTAGRSPWWQVFSPSAWGRPFGIGINTSTFQTWSDKKKGRTTEFVSSILNS